MTPARRRRLFERLRAADPSPTTELRHASPFELLIAVMLSAQATDRSVNAATARLFPLANTPQALLALGSSGLKRHIRAIGLYNTKAANLLATCRLLIEHHGGEVPCTRAALEALPGVGRKTANLVRAYAFGKPGIICDTHVLRVTGRLGLTTNTDPERVEADLARFLPERDWTAFSTVIMTHGRRCCTARNPNCPGCPVLPLCPEGLRITGGHGAHSGGVDTA